MDVRAAALAFPASAALALLAVRGRAVFEGEGARAFLVLAATGAAALGTAVAAAVRERRRRLPAVSAQVAALLRGIATPLGDAAVAFDPLGRLVWANDAAVALSGYAPEALLGRGRQALGDDLAVLLRGLGHGPAAGRVAIATPAGRVPADAAAVRVPGAPPLDVAALRVLPPEAEADAPAVEDADIVPDPPPALESPLVARAIASVSAELRAPLARASASAALLRLVLPGGQDAAGDHLARIEDGLREAEATLAALTAPLQPPAPVAVDVDALLSEALAGVAFAPGVRIRRVAAGAIALADGVQLRQALRHLLRIAAAAMPSGGDLGLRSARRGAEVVLEIADTGAGAEPSLDLPLAERLVAAQRGRLERAAVPGRGAVCRLVLPAAPARLRAARSAV
ncbi:MAG TPA: hypothetical protein VF904_12705 [Anaeromyxobacteraceae bacterium]